VKIFSYIFLLFYSIAIYLISIFT